MGGSTKAMMVGVLALILSASGCGAGAVHVRRGAWSGELALHGELVEAEYAAQRAMLDHCSGRWRILTGAEAERAELADGRGASHEVSSDASGRRVHYVCTSRAPAAFRAPSSDDATTLTLAHRGGR